MLELVLVTVQYSFGVCVFVCVRVRVSVLEEFLLILLLCNGFALFKMETGSVFCVNAVDTAQINLVSPYCTTF